MIENVKTLVAECQITMDQLKLGDGIREEFDMFKDAQLVGKILIESKYFLPPQLDFLDEAGGQEKVQGFSIAPKKNRSLEMAKPVLGLMPMIGSPKLSKIPKMQ